MNLFIVMKSIERGTCRYDSLYLHVNVTDNCFRDPNVGPYPVAVPWEEFNPARENFLRECPNFETGNYHEDEVDRFNYWTEVYPELVEFPPDPDIPTSLSDFPAPTEEGKLD